MRAAVAEQRRLMLLRWLRYIPALPLPVLVPNVGWWLARQDVCGQAMLNDEYEGRERRFVQSVLRTGMTVVDVGAHHGLYTLLASRKVGPQGRVLAIEPSTRERNHLLKHLRLNRCRNVHVDSTALGSEPGWGELFVIDGMETGCNCLRVPNVSEASTRMPVYVETLDGCLLRHGIGRVDFMKIDVEGGELDLLKGASRLLERPERPIILAEVEDLRTATWGYPARKIVEFLCQYGFRWFRFAETGLEPAREDCPEFNENLVAIPRERGLPDLPSEFGTGTDDEPC
jgi:FkbM family methyltransferase